MSIDVAIPGDRNVIKKEAEKILKYEDLVTEIQCMWNVKAKVIPVIIGATVMLPASGRLHSPHSSPPDSPASQQLQQDRQLQAVERSRIS